MKNIVILLCFISIACITSISSIKYINETQYEKERRGSSVFLKMFPRINSNGIAPSAADVPSCDVNKKFPYRQSPVISLFGVKKTFTAVLTGYPPNSSPLNFRQNRGYLYGWSGTIRPGPWGKTRFSFFREYIVTPPRKGATVEYCAHIYSPAISIGKSIEEALGTPYRSDKRNFGSDENLDRIVLRESSRSSKKVMSCCYLIHN